MKTKLFQSWKTKENHENWLKWADRKRQFPEQLKTFIAQPFLFLHIWRQIDRISDFRNSTLCVLFVKVCLHYNYKVHKFFNLLKIICNLILYFNIPGTEQRTLFSLTKKFQLCSKPFWRKNLKHFYTFFFQFDKIIVKQCLH